MEDYDEGGEAHGEHAVDEAEEIEAPDATSTSSEDADRDASSDEWT